MALNGLSTFISSMNPHKQRIPTLRESLLIEGFTWDNAGLSRQIVHAWKKIRDQASEKHGRVARSSLEYWKNEKVYSQGKKVNPQSTVILYESIVFVGKSLTETLPMKDCFNIWKKTQWPIKKQRSLPVHLPLKSLNMNYKS